MNQGLISPHLFCQLKTHEEKNKAYAELWDAWQTKGEKKEVLNQKVKKTKRQRQKGADKTNELAINARNFLIKAYWDTQHSNERITAKLILKQLHQQSKKEVKHLTLKVVERWYTAIKKTWGDTTWPNDEDALSEFSDKAQENYQVLIKRKPRIVA